MFFIIVVSASDIVAQTINWNSQPQTGFVFRITNKEAQKILTKSRPDTIVSSMLHTQVDTFNIEKGWTNRPDKGHFILARIIENKVHCEYTSVFPYQVLLLKEYDALSLQVLDLDGNVREDAKVKFKARRIHLDPLTKTYRVENEWFTGSRRVVTVELDGFRSVFNINKHDAPEWYNSFSRHDDGPDFYSYMITDKNRYKPGERVRFKSYALSGSKSPIKKDLQVTLWNRGRPTKIGIVSPHRPGSFTGEIYLHDSLRLLLDQHYQLQLTDKRDRVVANCNFRYEDYELTGSHLKLELNAAEQFHPASNVLKISATDDNGLLLKDARVTITVMTGNVNDVFAPVVIMPDTLMQQEMKLDPDAPTSLEIPSSIFKQTNTSYFVRVVLLNSQNERIEQQVSATHFYSQYEMSARFSNDSIVYELRKNGASQQMPMAVVRNDDTKSDTVMLPYREKINPALTHISFKNELLSRTFTLAHMLPSIKIAGGIKKDSFRIAVDNPQRLQLSWYVYQGSLLIAKGFGADVKYDTAIEDITNSYYVELLYSFGGTDHIHAQEYKIRRNALDVEIDLPERIYPGQHVDASIQVTDVSGRPVRGVDLTAFATTAKLQYYPASLPHYGGTSAPRSKGATFDKENLTKHAAILNLNYERWAKRAGLDTMKYYQLIYPRQTFAHETTIADSTQFAIFIMKDGIAKKPYVIEVDRKPVYYAWANQLESYSFYVEPNKMHEISLRLHDRVIILDSICFSKGKKTIISLDLDKLPQEASALMFKPEKVWRGFFRKTSRWSFTKVEQRRHQPLLAVFHASESPNYLVSGNQFIPISAGKQPRRQLIIGPVVPGMQTYVEHNKVQTTYRHVGSFAYSFEDNIVYKTDVGDLIPKVLSDISFRPGLHLNDLAITKEALLREVSLDLKWHPSVVHMIDPQCRVKIMLPYEEAQSGVASVFFENCETHAITSPCKQYSNRSDHFTLPRGCYHTIVLYENGKYHKMRDTQLASNTTLVVDMRGAALKNADSNSDDWLKYQRQDCFDSRPVPHRTYTIRNVRASYGNVQGHVFSTEDGSLLPGVNVVVKGTTNGTVTDENGSFVINIAEDPSTLVFSFIGLQTVEVEVSPGAQIDVSMVSDVTQLSEIVVTAYGIERSRSALGYSTVLQGRVAGVNIRGSDEAGDEEDVLVSEDDRRDAEDALYNELLNVKTIRSNFNDVAFWEPRLFTDRNGRSSFSVTFPDDITRWDAVVYAMNRRLQTGTARKSIKAYKPLMAQLHTPRFLTVGDSALFSAKVLNYTNDKTIDGVVSWTGMSAGEKKITFSSYHADQLPVVAINLDSITSAYSFTRIDGYFDGEKRSIPVVAQGTLRAEGKIKMLQAGDQITVQAKAGETISVQFVDNAIDLYSRDVQFLLNYRYDCNEQLASKLMGLLAAKLIDTYEGKTFKYDKDINRIIGRLLKNQNTEFLWSWWNVSPNTSYWMSAHILHALKAAKDAGYKVDLDINNVARKATYRFDYLNDPSLSDVDLLHALAFWSVDLDYPKYLAAMETLLIKADSTENARSAKYRRVATSLLKKKLLLLETRQLRGIGFVRDSLLQYKKETILSEIYFTDFRPAANWYDDELLNNAIAYRMIIRDSVMRSMTGAMQMYFISKRRDDGWNTFETSNILMSVLPGIIATGSRKTAPATISLTGNVTTDITKFPHKLTLPEGEVQINHIAGAPMYFMQYFEERVTEARAGTDALEINTTLDRPDLRLGKIATLRTEVHVKRDAKLAHIMIEIPIPAGCSYADKRTFENRFETHREYFKEKVVIFCEHLPEGKYQFNVSLLPRFAGKYHINPAQVSLMYFPVINANTELKKAGIRE